MKLHPNAKTTPYARQLLVDRVCGLGWSMADAAQAAGAGFAAQPRIHHGIIQTQRIYFVLNQRRKGFRGIQAETSGQAVAEEKNGF